ncbi:hypothetical protein [Tessaracoccus lacteus]|uniref:DUF5666 domain-containing protein n=1 Tax=Tessaracoccus lacteus TaxID=3041766 RepID=A0ABY8PWK5_9ACTN|nr:hypothetical protein [Tessaracoccus sp. T21]WGT46835.1 hypothetical protein QH948_11950 [Tessaracoccus sp. T21]
MTTRTFRIATSIAAVAALALAGCSGTTTAETSTAPSAQSTGQPDAAASGAPGSGGQGGGMQINGTFGIIAAVQDSTLQVQGDDGQTAVTYTDDTTFTTQVTGSIDDLATGLCVSGMGTGDDSSVTASSLTVTEATDDGCTGGFSGGFGGGGERPSGDASGAPSGMPSMDPSSMPTDMPSDMASMDPGSMPSGAPEGGGMGGGSFISGEITAVDGDTVTVNGPDDTESTFTVSDDTTITTTTDASLDDAVEGVCALAQGDTDDTGAVTATSIALSEATDGECSMGSRAMGGW